MKWAWKIARVAEIDIFVHVTFLAILAWAGLSEYGRTQTLEGALIGIAFISTVFAIVVLHELGHALTARRFGIKTRDIVLLPIGGVARLEKIPKNPREEFLVAIAGPAVNVVLAALIGGILVLTGQSGALFDPEILVNSFFGRLVWVNVALAIFNLLPAFPMDGGRVLRALLAMNMDHVRATRIAATLGQGLALMLGILGLFTNPILAFVALFIWLGAAQESSMNEIESALKGIPVDHAMITEFHVLRPDQPLRVPVELILHGFQPDFPVTERGEVVGLLTRRELLRTLAERGQDVPVGEVMGDHPPIASPHDMVEQVLEALMASESETALVMSHGRLVGLITRENISELLMLQAALRGPRRPAAAYSAAPTIPL